MAEFARDFDSLPTEFQDVLRLAEDTLDIEVTPLQALKGGRTGAYLFLASVSFRQTRRLRHLILKLDHKSKTTKLDELGRHSAAIKEAPPAFARDHIAELALNRVELGNTVAIFYSIAGQSLHRYSSLASYQQQHKLEIIFSATSNLLLAQWNTNSTFDSAVHPQKILAHWLGYRLQSGCNIEHFLEERCHIHHDTAGLLIQGNVFPNPLAFARNSELWNEVRPIDIIVGFQHGDLNIGNILASFGEDNVGLTGIFLIDFALYKSGMPLLYDQCYLEVSYLIRELSRVSVATLADMLNRFAERDIVDPHQVPIELAGACAVLGAGREAFGNWVQESHPSLSDDLWGQFWLAAVAAGLNYCNKTALNEKERLAGLIFAAAHLKRYHSTFRVSLPVEVKHLDIVSQTGESTKSGPEILRHRVPRHNLPLQSTPFIGRQEEFTVARALLQRDTTRLVTMTGPGGTGKTRLALQVAADLIDTFEDGARFVDLASTSEPDAVLAAIARTVGLREASDRPLLDELTTSLKEKKLLLLLDNCEQVTTVAPRIGTLLRDCPGVKLLVTSREALHLRGEHVFPVPPLTLPGADLKRLSLQELAGSEAVQLFVERASAVKPDFELTKENARAIAELCSRLDGLPLAIELAASRSTLFSPQALLERVGNRLRLLRGGARDLPVRQQTLRDAIDWSFDLLGADEQRLFVLLSVFFGFTIEAVEAVAQGIAQLADTPIDAVDGLASLLDKSLVRRIEQNNGESRLLMLETIREYAKEQLAKDAEINAAALRAHAVYFADFAELQWKRLTSSAREAALREIEPDIENVRTAWKYWVDDGNLGQLHKLADCLWLLYDARGWYYATVELTVDLLKVLSSTPSTPERAHQEIMLQTSLARVLMAVKGFTPEVEKAYTRALELCEKHGEIPQSFPVLRALASFYVYVADFEKSVGFGERILSLGEQLNDGNMRVEGHLVIGYSLTFRGDLSHGLEHLEKGISIYTPEIQGSHSFRFGNNPGVTSFTTSAICLWMLGFPDRALKLADDAIALAKKLNHPFSIAYALFHTGLLHLWMREVETVRERAQAVLDIAEKHEFQIWKAAGTCLYGAALAGLGRGEDGLMEITQGIAMYTELKTPPVFWPLLLLIRAGACIQAGRPKEALTLIEEALGILGQGTGNPLLAEFYRLKGDILLNISQINLPESESLFRQALDLAKKHHTTMFELTTAMSLSKLLQKQSKREEGHRLLSEVYAKFTEGFSTADMIEAGGLLQELS